MAQIHLCDALFHTLFLDMLPHVIMPVSMCLVCIKLVITSLMHK